MEMLQEDVAVGQGGEWGGGGGGVESGEWREKVSREEGEGIGRRTSDDS